ncbi:MAG: hypothetical protein N3A62_10670 [Thermodesulfovibrionales bacterium]|nr:hypothetical protein [Thermodesulfovibrionales bacterium]
MKYLLFRLIAYLKHKGLIHKSYIVGGAVRDIIFGRDLKDIDIAIDAEIGDIVEEFAYAINGSLICLDKEMSIYRIVKKKYWVDISRLRCGSLYIDLFERDLTINAMALPLSDFQGYEKNLIDPFGGYSDYQNGIIRMVREENFLKDPLRVLRAFRFSATLGFKIEPNTMIAVSRFSHYLKDVARERIYDELLMIICCQDSAKIVSLMKNNRILTHIFSVSFTDNGIKRYFRIELLINDLHFRYGDYSYLFKQYINNSPNLFCLKFFTLFDDKRDISPAGLSLKISKKESERLQTYVDYQGTVYEGFKNNEDVQSEYIIRLLYELADDIFGLILLDTVIDDFEDKRFTDYVKKIVSFYTTDYRQRFAKIPLISGDDIIQSLNLKPSAIFKKIINYTNMMTLLGKISNKQEAIDLIRKQNWAS